MSDPNDGKYKCPMIHNPINQLVLFTAPTLFTILYLSGFSPRIAFFSTAPLIGTFILIYTIAVLSYFFEYIAKVSGNRRK